MKKIKDYKEINTYWAKLHTFPTKEAAPRHHFEVKKYNSEQVKRFPFYKAISKLSI